MTIEKEKNDLHAKKNAMISQFKLKIQLLEKELEVEVHKIQRMIDNVEHREKVMSLRKAQGIEEI
ncbi:hypothetical protein N9777_08505 [Ascidiaceihabitans sp.]|nr:hypothetical protein [Ascidiaceihabitans sp.]